MITGYQIRSMINQEEVLILYIQMEEEFSLEWFQELKTKGFQDFISKYRILWNGTKVFLVVGGLTLAVFNYHPVKENEVRYISDTLLLPLVTEKKEISLPNAKVEVGKFEEDVITYGERDSFLAEVVKPSKENSNVNSNFKPSSTLPENVSKPPQNVVPDKKEEVDTAQFFSIYRSNGSVVQLTMEEYLIGVVAAEMPASFHIEALKAQSILARTYAMKVVGRGGKLTDTVSTQRYIDKKEMEKLWGTSYSSYYQKIRDAVLSTGNLVVMYQGSLIDAVYHSTSNGRTEDSEAVWGNSFPYLQSVDSKWDVSQSSYMRSVSFSKAEFLRIFGLTEERYEAEILKRNRSGRVENIRIGNQIYSGVEVCTKLGLRSADFDISLNDDEVVFTTRGYGHGVGLSQYGANGMAKEGYSASHILKHYYTGVEIKELS